MNTSAISPVSRANLRVAVDAIGKRAQMGLVALTLLVASVPVRAEAPPSGPPRLALPSLDWEAPPDCPSASAVSKEVRRLVGHDVDVDPGGAGAWNVRAVVVHDDRWRVALETTIGGRTKRRALEAESCAGLADATAWILALMIDPVAMGQSGTPPAASALDPAAPPPAAASSAAPPRVGMSEPPPERDAPSTTSPPTIPQPKGSAQAGPRILGATWVGPVVAIDAGAAPNLGAGLGAALGVELARIRLSLSIVDGIGARNADVSNPPGGGGSFQILSGEISGCPLFAWHSLTLGPCAAVALGRIEAESYGVTRSLPTSVLWVGVGPGAVASLSVSSHWRATVGVDALISLSRPRFYLRNVEGVVFRPALVAEKIWMGPELVF